MSMTAALIMVVPSLFLGMVIGYTIRKIFNK